MKRKFWIPELPTSRRKFLVGAGAALASTTLGRPALAQSKEMTIISNIGDATQRGVLQRVASEFEKASGVKVTINNMDHEANKTAIRSYLVRRLPRRLLLVLRQPDESFREA